jgi:ribosomal protein S18 acetylase RimI-like enzyme
LTAAVASNSSWSGEGLRRYEARRDMAALADLIETAFGERLDESGRRMISEMRFLGRAGWLGWLLSRWLLPPAANPFGFVWEVDGKVVGNASLLPVEHFNHRWVIANVAVLPEQRGKGIAGRLVDASVDFALRRGARKLILQVDADNERALALYRRRGFYTTATRTIWTVPHAPPSLNTIDHGLARKRHADEWRLQWALAKRLHPEGLIWPYPTVSSFFRPGGMERWISTGEGRHWVWEEGGRLLGSLTLRRSNQPGGWRIILVVEPESRGRLEAPLLAAGLEAFQESAWGFVLDYPHDAAGELLHELGFRAQRTLTWMATSVEGQVNQ